MKEQVKYNNKEFIISAYNTKIERELLLTAASDEATIDDIGNLNLDIYLRELEPLIETDSNIFKLSETEKLFIIYKLRGISVSNILKISIACVCNNKFNANIDINEIIKEGNINHPKLKDIYSENIKDYFIENPENLDILEYEELEDFIISNQTQFKFLYNFKCAECGQDITVNLKNPQIYKRSFSENNILEFYKSITRLSFSGKFSINGILNDLYPFERDIFINQINDEIEERNKNKQKTQY